MKEKTTITANFFAKSIKTLKLTAQFLVFAVLALPIIAFGKTVYLNAYAVSSIDLWSNGVILRASSGSSDSANNYRWFEFSSYRNFSSINSTPKKAYSGDNQYFEKITNLSPDTMYYFRAVNEIDGIRRYGSIMRFKTKKSGYGEPSDASGINGYYYSGGNSYSNTSGTSYPTSNTSNTSNTVNTSPYQASFSLKASGFTDTSATINGRSLSSGNYTLYGWFEWGETTELEKTTARVFLGKSSDVYFNHTLTGLTPGTAYFFRPVTENNNGTKSFGTTFAFRTTGVSPYPSNSTSQNKILSGNTSTASKPAVNSSYGKDALKDTDVTEKTILIKEVSGEKISAPGEQTNKTISFENTTGKKLNNVIVRVILPEGETYIAEENSDCTQSGQVLTCDIGIMAIGQKITIVYKTEISKEAKDKTTLETIIIVSGEDKDGVKIQNVQNCESVVDIYKESKKSTAVAALSSNSIFPKTIKDWFFVISFIFLLVIAYLGWKYYSEKTEEDQVDFSEVSDFLTLQNFDVNSVPKKPVVQELVLKTAPINERGAPPPNLPI